MSAHIWVACLSARLAISADGSAHATVLTTTSLDAFARAQHHSTLKSQNTTSRARATWSSVKLSDFGYGVINRTDGEINRQEEVDVCIMNA